MAVAHFDVEHSFVVGDPASLSSAYNMWGALIYTVACRGSDSLEAAVEITQRTFLSVWQGGGVTSGLTVKSRLILTARTLVHGYLAEQGAGAEVHADADDVIDRVVVRDELTALREPARSIVRSAIVAGHGPVELAQSSGLSSSAVAELIEDSVGRLVTGLAGSRGV